MANLDNDVLNDTSEEESENEGHEIHFNKKQLKEKNFRLSLAQQSQFYRAIMKCTDEDQFHKSLDTQSKKSLMIILKSSQNVYKGNNIRVITERNFKKIKIDENLLVDNLSKIKISKMNKESIKNVLKSLKLPLLKRLLKLHKRCGISDYE